MSMEVKKINTLEPGSLGQVGGVNKNERMGQGPSFQDTLAGLDKLSDLNKVATNNGGVSGLKFSNHAIERMRSRGVSFSPEQMDKLEMAVKKAADKGGRDSLILMNDKAVIVSVKNNTVVTVVDKASLKENVFTNIDSTIVV